MLGQMHSGNRKHLPPCPCGGICQCHIPRKKMTSFEKKIIICFTLMLFSPVLIATIYEHYHPYTGPDHIEVNGKMCEIGYREDCASPMSCSHKVAICRK